MTSVRTRSSATLAGSLSTKPTNAPLYRRLLLPHLPTSTSPPPLLVSASSEVNEELYDLLALALRAYITPWWSKITRYDREFLPHVATVLAEVIRSLEVRVVTADLPQLLLRVLPVLVAQHYVDYRSAAAKIGSSYSSGGGASLPQLFHNMQSHIAIDAEGHIDPEYFRLAFDHVLSKTLPSQDGESDVEQTIIREIMVKVLLVDVIPQLSQPWFINHVILDLLSTGPELVQSTVKTADLAINSSHSHGFSTVVVIFLSTVQYLSGLCLNIINGYKQMRNTVRVVNASSDPPSGEQQDFATCLVFALSEVFSLRDRSASNAILTTIQFITRFFHSFLDRLLTFVLLTSVLTEQRIFMTIKLAKSNLFPNGYPGPPPVIPTAEEQIVIREQLVCQVERRIPLWFGSAVLGYGPVQRQTIIDALAPLSSQAGNAHLILFLLDAIIVALFPELGVTLGNSPLSSIAVTRDGSVQSTRESLDDGEGGTVSPLASPGLGSDHTRPS